MVPKQKALILSGGGVYAASTLGTLKRILEENNDYDIIAGTSAGAINAAYLASADDMMSGLNRLIEIWQSLSSEKIYKKKWFGFLSSLFSGSVYDMTPLHSFLKTTLSNDLKKKLFIGVTDISNGRYFEVEAKDNIVDYVIASASFPFYFSPVKIGNNQYADGGIKSYLPIEFLNNENVGSVDVILAKNVTWNKPLPKWPTSFNVVKILGRVLEVTFGEVTIRDIFHLFGLCKARGITLRIFVPKETGLECTLLDFNANKIAQLIAEGYSASTMEELDFFEIQK